MIDLTERLCEMAHETFGIDMQEMRDGTSFEELGVDSLALIEFTIDIQREFDVLIDDGELKAHLTIADTAELLASRGLAA